MTGAGRQSPEPARAARAARTKGPGAVAQAVMVEAITATTAPMPQTITAVGSLRSDESVTLRPRSRAASARSRFQEGQRGREGRHAGQARPRRQRGRSCSRRKANLTLAQDQVRARRSTSQKSGSSPARRATRRRTTSRSRRRRRQLAAARLAKTEIRAPFSGVIGLRSVSVGDYVKEGQDMVNLESIDPLKVDFRVPEIVPVAGAGRPDAADHARRAARTRPTTGTVFAINPLVDAAGRAIVIRAQVRNHGHGAAPGHVRPRAPLHAATSAMRWSCPSRRSCRRATSKFVYRVVDGKAARTKVEIGQRRDGKVEVAERRHAKDDVIVTAGQLKLRDGMSVTRAAPSAQVPPPAHRPRRSEQRRRAPAKADSGAREPLRSPDAGLPRGAAMHLPEICIKRPVFATVLSLVILLIGLISYTRLSVREYPRIDEPVVSVIGDVSRRVRRGRRVAGHQAARGFALRHRGRRGDDLAEPVRRRSRINVRFTLTRDPDSAAADVRDKVARARGKLPDDDRRAGHRQGRGRLAARHLHRRAGGHADAARGLRLREALHASRACRCCRAPPTCASSASGRFRCASTSTARGSPPTS